jgi:hypothetical protein
VTAYVVILMKSPMRSHCHTTLLHLVSVLVICLYVPSTVAGGAGNSDWNWEVQGGGVSQFDADIDSGGKVNANRYFVDLSTSRRNANGTRVGASLSYGQSDYDFSGPVQIGSTDPWNRIQQASLSASIFYPVDERLTLYGIPSIRFDGERGVSFVDGQTLGVLGGASYRFNDRLTIGPGFGAFEELEGGTDLFPILIVDWKITDELSLETGRGFAASRGPGLQLRWRSSSAWQFAFGARYEKQRFRLDDTGAAPDGIGEDKSLPIYAVAQYQATPNLVFSVIGGAETGGELRLENSNGLTISESDLDTAPFLGATLKFRM